MNKLGSVLIVIAVIAACYLIILVTIPNIVVPMIESANATMTADVDNLTAYPGSQDLMISTPWILLWVPGVIGMIVIVLILRSK